MRRDRIIYSINVEDVQTVAQEELGRPLSDHELRTIVHRLGDYLDWYEAVASVLANHLQQQEPAEPGDFCLV
jgi:hypothetical protein